MYYYSVLCHKFNIQIQNIIIIIINGLGVRGIKFKSLDCAPASELVRATVTCVN